jgi:hypothetical protein
LGSASKPHCKGLRAGVSETPLLGDEIAIFEKMRWHKCRVGANVMVGEMAGGTNIGATQMSEVDFGGWWLSQV